MAATRTTREKVTLASTVIIAISAIVVLTVAWLAPPQAQAHIAWHSIRVHFLETGSGVFLAACLVAFFARPRRPRSW